MLVCELGSVDYRSALALQERLRQARWEGLIPDTLLLLEHDPPVYTRGRRHYPGELSMGEDWYAAKGIEIIDTRRGGKVTYHGPGQLVGYPIVAVDDVLGYVRTLERALVAALGQIGVRARARVEDGPDYTGVWVENRKIASIGVHVSHGVTMHGFALNVEARALEPFTWVIACGLPDVHMTSIESERGDADVGLPAATTLAGTALAQALGHRVRYVARDDLESLLGAAVAGREEPAGSLSGR